MYCLVHPATFAPSAMLFARPSNMASRQIFSLGGIGRTFLAFGVVAGGATVGYRVPSLIA
jgi:hypothetical protein